MNKDAVVLIVDDEKDHADVLVEALGDQCGSITAVYTAAAAIEAIEKRRFDLVITDMDLGDEINGIDILERAKLCDASTAVIVVTDCAAIDTCKEAIRKGAYDYLTKPVDIEQLKSVVGQLHRAKKSRYEAAGDFAFEGVISRSHSMQAVFSVVRKVSPTSISVLIEGESGTGKELMARAIHDNSRRKGQAFKPLNCAGLTESLLESELFGHAKGAFTGATGDRKGLFEMADKGTLFLDEIGDMPLSMQAKLLRVLEDGIVTPVGSNRSVVVDVRVISATNHNLTKLVEEKKFRQDLYFRIKGVSITIPPLRSRSEDIPELFGFFLKDACDEIGCDITRITESAMSILQGYGWPGNIRQLRNAVRTMVVMCEGDTLDSRDVPGDIYGMKRLSGRVAGVDVIDVSMDTTGKSLEEVEASHIIKTLEATRGNRAEAAKILKIGERTLYRKIKEYGL